MEDFRQHAEGQMPQASLNVKIYLDIGISSRTPGTPSATLSPVRASRRKEEHESMAVKARPKRKQESRKRANHPDLFRDEYHPQRKENNRQ